MINAQKWLDKQYPENKGMVDKIKVGLGGLDGPLNLINFVSLKELDIQNYEWWNRNKINSKEKENKVKALHNIASKLERLKCGGNEIEELHLKDNKNLVILDCSRNGLTDLDLSGCPNLKELYCRDNKLSDIKRFLDTLPNPKNLEWLDISGNGIMVSDLSFLSKFKGLKKLSVADNELKGGLQSLKEMSKLEELDVSDTDIDSGLECLPSNLKEIYCEVTNRRPKALCYAIKEDLKKYYNPNKRTYNYQGWIISELPKKQTSQPKSNVSEQEIVLDKFKQFLAAKSIFLNTRRGIIKKLQECYNQLVETTEIHAGVEEVNKCVSSIGEISFTLGIPKAIGGISNAVNNLLKNSSSNDWVKEFQGHLVNDNEKILPCFKEVYNSLSEAIKEDRVPELTSEITNILNLKNEIWSKEEVKLFNTDYKVYEVTRLWEEKPLSAEEMKKAIIYLSENLKELKAELVKEESRFKELGGQYGYNVNNDTKINNVSGVRNILLFTK